MATVRIALCELLLALLACLIACLIVRLCFVGLLEARFGPLFPLFVFVCLFYLFDLVGVQWARWGPGSWLPAPGF